MEISKMKRISRAFWQQISRTVFLTLAVSLTTGCSWVTWSNSSIRGGESTHSPSGVTGYDNAVPVTLVEKGRTTRDREKAGPNEIEASFAFEKPLKEAIDAYCSGDNDCSHEKISYESKLCAQPGSCRADLFVLEFDDQGRLYHPEQLEHLFEFLQETMSPHTCNPGEQEPCFDDVSLVVAAHGWRHNADFEDWNLRQLREVLYSAVLFEAHKSRKAEHRNPLDSPQSNTDDRWNPSNKPRKVVGVYLGWRGATVKEGWIESNLLSKVLFTAPVKLSALVTFWDRKGAALDVALGSTRELFARLGHIRANINDMNDPDNKAKRMGRAWEWYDSCKKLAEEMNNKCVAMRTLILGHSFGSLAIYNAISESLIDSVSAGIYNSPDANEPVSSPYADLIVLINPAFEGARFEPLYQASLNRMKRSPYLPTQDPVLVLVTGTSDYATKYAFPIGRFFSTLFQDNSPESKDGNEIGRRADEERSANRRTVGHIPRYMTHYLDSFLPTPSIEQKKDMDGNSDACLTTGWEQLTSEGLPDEKPLAAALDDNAKIWKQKLQANKNTKQGWPARAFCGGLRLSVAMQEAQEGEDPLDDLSDDRSHAQDPWSNQLLSKEILPDKWGQGLRSPHNPIWVVRTKDTNIIDGHNGFLNPRMEGFIQQLYREALNPQ
jgi:hypothetical protein